jgi:hypothetical protein
MDKFQRGCEERSNAKAKSLARQRIVGIDSDDEAELTSVVQQDSAFNPNVVDGKQKFGFAKRGHLEHHIHMRRSAEGLRVDERR